MQLHIRAQVPGIDDTTFQKLVMDADQTCPVSNLLRDSLDIKNRRYVDMNKIELWN